MIAIHHLDFSELCKGQFSKFPQIARLRWTLKNVRKKNNEPNILYIFCKYSTSTREKTLLSRSETSADYLSVYLKTSAKFAQYRRVHILLKFGI